MNSTGTKGRARKGSASAAVRATARERSPEAAFTASILLLRKQLVAALRADGYSVGDAYSAVQDHMQWLVANPAAKQRQLNIFLLDAGAALDRLDQAEACLRSKKWSETLTKLLGAAALLGRLGGFNLGANLVLGESARKRRAGALKAKKEKKQQAVLHAAKLWNDSVRRKKNMAADARIETDVRPALRVGGFSSGRRTVVGYLAEARRQGLIRKSPMQLR